MKVVKKISELFKIATPDTAIIEINDPPHANTPALQSNYYFNKDTVKKLILWNDGIGGHSLILSGPTGCGKSSLGEQFCARLGLGLYRVACHGRMEFPELIGGHRLASEVGPQGEVSIKPASKWEALLIAIKSLTGLGPRMIWVDGPVVRAMREGCVVLLDEFNFLHPTVFGGLNTILDAATFTIPETGETISAARGFRIMLTGNGVDGGADAVLYRGISKVNIAGLDRPCGMRVKYNSPTEDAAIILAAHPQISPVIIDVMVKLAEKVREGFASGQMETVISTRKLVQWASLIEARPWKNDTANDILELLKKTLDFALLDVRPPQEQEAIHTMLDTFLRQVPPSGNKP